jgi:hypothetical protein
MPNSPKIVGIKDIPELIKEVMPQLSSFVAGRRVASAKNVNYQIALLRDSLGALSDAEKKKFTSQSVHGNNPGGAVFSGIEKATGLKLSTSLGDVIKRYDDTILENKSAEYFADNLAQEMPGAANERRADALSQELANGAATKIQAAFRGQRARNDLEKKQLAAENIQAAFRNHNRKKKGINGESPIVKPMDKLMRTLEGYRAPGVLDKRKIKKNSPATPAPKVKNTVGPTLHEAVHKGIAFSNDNPIIVNARSTPAVVATAPVSDARGQEDILLKSALALQARIAGRTGRGAEELRAEVARTVNRETESITPPPGSKPRGKSTHLG